MPALPLGFFQSGNMRRSCTICVFSALVLVVVTTVDAEGQSCKARSAGAALAWKACPVPLLREQLQSRKGGYGYGGGGYGSEAKPSKKKAQAMISGKSATPRAKGDLPYSESSYESPAAIAARKDGVPTAAELRKYYWLRGCKTVLNKAISVSVINNRGRRGKPYLTNTCTRKVFPCPPVPGLGNPCPLIPR